MRAKRTSHSDESQALGRSGHETETPRRALFGIPDPSWLFLLAGIALGVSATLIPAFEDVAEARDVRDKALEVENRRRDRLARYERYLEALDERDPRLIQTLAATQLSLTPAQREPIEETDRLFESGAMVLYELEPPPPAFVERKRPESHLYSLATGQHTRLWLLAIAGALTLFGILPATRAARSVDADADEEDWDEQDWDEQAGDDEWSD